MDSPSIITENLSRETVDFLCQALWIRYDREREQIETWERRAKQTNESLACDAMRDEIAFYQAVRVEWQKLRTWLRGNQSVTHKTDQGHTLRDTQTA